MSREPRTVWMDRLLRAVQTEAESSRDPATAYRARLICKGFRSGVWAATDPYTTHAEMAALLRQEVFGTPVPQPEVDDDE